MTIDYFKTRLCKASPRRVKILDLVSKVVMNSEENRTRPLLVNGPAPRARALQPTLSSASEGTPRSGELPRVKRR
jgi:hypothetical protein